jgi:hypothetical protein
MRRLFLAAVTALVLAGPAAAQCQPWYPLYPVAPPAYPLTPAVWGAPVPKPLPQVLPATPARATPAIREDDEPAAPTRPARKSKNGTKDPGEDKDRDGPRIPKTKLPIPGDPLDKAVPEVPKADRPKTDTAKNDAPPAKTFEQYVIPSEGRGEPQAQVRVGFFNHTQREIVLDVNGEPLRLPKEEYVTVRLPRTFTWAEKGAKGNEVVVPPDADGIEIVFRK